MNPGYADIELIERYLEGKLTAEEIMNFEKRIQTDPSFAEQFKAQKIANVFLEDYEMLQLKKQMQAEMPKSSGGNSNYLIYAGAIALIGIIGYFTLKNSSDSNSTETNLQSKKENKTELPASDNSTINSDNQNLNPTSDNNITQKTETSSDPVIIANNTEPVNNTIPVEQDKKNNTVNSVTEKDSLPKQTDCSKLVIDNSIKKENTCEGKNKGSITIKISGGGTPPYQFKLNTKQGYTSSNTFNFLAAGDYYVSIKESSGCIIKLKDVIKIEATPCHEPFNETFNPSQENVWKLPIEAGLSGKIIFHNKAGLVVHEIVVQNGQPSEWDGINSKGEETPAGYYYVTIEKSDGSIEYGYLTINR